MKTDYPFQVTQVDFAVPTHYTIGPRFLSWGEAVNHARSLIQRTVYKGQRVRPHMDDYHPRRKFQEGDDLISYSRSFVQMRVVEPVQDRTDSAVRHGNDGVAMTWEVFHDGTVESRPDDRDVHQSAKPPTHGRRVHPASKDYGNDAQDAIEQQPAIQQMITDYDEFIAQLEAQIDDLKIERAELKSAAEPGNGYAELVNLLRNGLVAAMPGQYPDPYAMPHAEALNLLAQLTLAVETRAFQGWVKDQATVDNDAIEAAQPAGNPVDVYSPDQPGIVLFSGTLTGAGRYGGWSRVVPGDAYIDLPPGYRIERKR